MTASSGPPDVRLRGRGLHSGLPSEVTLRKIDGPVVFRTPGGSAALDELSVVRSDLGVRVRCGAAAFELDSVEHLLAALGGLSVRSGVAVETNATELPLLDGAALRFAEAVGRLGAPREPPRLRVLSPGTVDLDGSRYEFAPGESVTLHVEIDFDAKEIGRQAASWDGSPASFLRDVAWARTFGFRREAEALRKAGRARGVDPGAVMVLDDQGSVQEPGAPARPGEFARHKLLDLVGDLYLFGGPPAGTIRATRPGHGATNRAMTAALERGIVGS